MWISSCCGFRVFWLASPHQRIIIYSTHSFLMNSIPQRQTRGKNHQKPLFWTPHDPPQTYHHSTTYHQNVLRRGRICESLGSSSWRPAGEVDTQRLPLDFCVALFPLLPLKMGFKKNPNLVGGFNLEKYQSNWYSSQYGGENKKHLKFHHLATY